MNLCKNDFYWICAHYLWSKNCSLASLNIYFPILIIKQYSLCKNEVSYDPLFIKPITAANSRYFWIIICLGKSIKWVIFGWIISLVHNICLFLLEEMQKY